MRRSLLPLALIAAAACDCGGPQTRQNAGELSIGADLQFGNVLVSSSKSLKVTVTNVGAGTLAVEGFEVPAPFSTPTEPFALNGGESAEIEVVYAPTRAAGLDEADRGELVVLNDTETPRAVVNLAGRGVVAPLFAPGSLDFGEVAAGELKQLELTVENRGTEGFTLQEATLSSRQFGGDVDRLRRAYAPGQKETVLLTFAPDSEGKHAADLVLLTDYAAQREVRVTLLGEGIVPKVRLCFGAAGSAQRCIPREEGGKTLYADTLDFGALDAGQSAEAEIVLINDGKVQVSLFGMAAGGAMTSDETRRKNPCNVAAPRQNFAFEPASFGARLPEDPTEQNPNPPSSQSLRATYFAGHECREDISDKARVAVGVGRSLTLEVTLVGASKVGQIQTRDVTFKIASTSQVAYTVQNAGLGPLQVSGAEIVTGDPGVPCDARVACPAAGKVECEVFRFAAPPQPTLVPAASKDAQGTLVPGSASVGNLVFDPAGLGTALSATGYARVDSDDPYQPKACGKLTGEKP